MKFGLRKEVSSFFWGEGCAQFLGLGERKTTYHSGEDDDHFFIGRGKKGETGRPLPLTF